MTEKREQFDLVVIGSGTAGGTVAARCRAAGWSVAIIDSRPFGGTCALRGCDPKKVLVGVAETFDELRRLEGRGLRARDAAINWAELIAFKNSIIEHVSESRKQSYAERGIVAIDAIARFLSPSMIAAGGRVLEFRHAMVATGARPEPLEFPGADLLIDSAAFLDLRALPERVVFVGGGYISFEFAYVAARAGARVSILHRGDRPLEAFDPDLVERLVARTRAMGIDVCLRTEVRRIEQRRRELLVVAGAPERETSVAADLVVHGAGRVADLSMLDLSAAGVRASPRGVVVNDCLQSVSNPGVFAAGDAAATRHPKLTPVAAYDGHVVAANLLEGVHRRADDHTVPSVVFTVPALARVGLGEHEARREKRPIRVMHQDTSGWSSSRRVAESHSAFKLIIDKETDCLLGAHLLGPHAEDTINLLTLAIRAGVKTANLKEMLFAYPTAASDVAHMM